MKKPLNQKKYTTSVRSLTPLQVERIRRRKLASAKTYREKRFYSSDEFRKTLIRNIKTNRLKVNIARLERISQQLGNTRERVQIVRQTLGESTLPGGRRVNTFTSAKQTERLKRIETNIKKNPNYIKRVLKSTNKYREIRHNLQSTASIADIITSLDRTNFYFENKKQIIKYNQLVQKHGVSKANTMKTGINLRNKYIEDRDLNSDDIDLLNLED